MTISLIAAVDKNGGIGNKNQLLAHIPEDLKRFKSLTLGKICIQGRRTYESIIEKLGYPLQDRVNIVLTKSKEFRPKHPETLIYHSVNDILREYYNYGNKEQEVMIIGGGQVYRDFLPYADKVYLTVIDYKFDEVDTYFPEMDKGKWILTLSEIRRDKHTFKFVTYDKSK